MFTKFSFWLFGFLTFTSFAQSEYSIDDYFSHNLELDFKVYKIMAQMSDTEMVAQMIMPAAGRLGKSDEKILNWIEKKYIGGILLLNGTKEGFQQKIDSFNIKNTSIPFWYSADAELSLINRKIANTAAVKNANKIDSSGDLITQTAIIAKELNDIGIQWNFAPVVDASPNKVVGFRSFSSDSSKIVSYSLIFNQILQKNGILATAKHFPGHGFVTGDTHKNLVYIDGEMKEVKHYPALIEKNVASVMIGHLAIKNNENFDSNHMPATLNKKIVTELLQDSLGFSGIIVTDAMNMGGVASIENAGIKAIEAGCDVILMPLDVDELVEQSIAKMNEDPSFKDRIFYSAMKVIRMKICLGVM